MHMVGQKLGCQVAHRNDTTDFVGSVEPFGTLKDSF